MICVFRYSELMHLHCMQCIHLPGSSYLTSQAAYWKYWTSRRSIPLKISNISSLRVITTRCFMYPDSLLKERRQFWGLNAKHHNAQGCQTTASHGLPEGSWLVLTQDLSVQAPEWSLWLARVVGCVHIGRLNRARGCDQSTQLNCCHHSFILCK